MRDTSPRHACLGEVSRKIWLHYFAINNNGGSVPVIFISLYCPKIPGEIYEGWLGLMIQVIQALITIFIFACPVRVVEVHTVYYISSIQETIRIENKLVSLILVLIISQYTVS